MSYTKHYPEKPDLPAKHTVFINNETKLMAEHMTAIRDAIQEDESYLSELDKTVVKTEAQTLTDAQKTQARKNIEAAGMHAITEEFSEEGYYGQGLLVWHEGKLYECISPQTVHGAWNEENWMEYTIAGHVAGQTELLANAIDRMDRTTVQTLPQDLSIPNQAQARANIEAQSTLNSDGSITLDLSNPQPVYIAGSVGQKIVYKESEASVTHVYMSKVQKGCEYVLKVTSGTLAATNARGNVIIDDNGTILQTENITLVDNGTLEKRFVANQDGYLCTCVDINTTAVTLHGGPLRTVASGSAESWNLLAPLCNVYGSATALGRIVSVSGCKMRKERISTDYSTQTMCVSLTGNTFHYWNAGATVTYADVVSQGLLDSDFVQCPYWMCSEDWGHFVFRMVPIWRSTSTTATNGKIFLATKSSDGTVSSTPVLTAANQTSLYELGLSWFDESGFRDKVIANKNIAIVYFNSNSQTGTDIEFYFGIERAVSDAKWLAPEETRHASQGYETGKLFTYSGRLYEATSAIATGEIVTEHAAQTTVAKQLENRDAAIAQEIAAKEQLMLDILQKTTLTPFERRIFQTYKRDLIVYTGRNERQADIIYNAVVSDGHDRDGSTYRTIWLTGSEPGPIGQMSAQTSFKRSRFSHFTPGNAETHKLILETHRITSFDDSFVNYSNNTPVLYILTYNPETEEVSEWDITSTLYENIDTDYGLSACLANGNIAIAIQFRRPTQGIDWRFNIKFLNRALSPYADDIPEEVFKSTGKYLTPEETTTEATT